MEVNRSLAENASSGHMDTVIEHDLMCNLIGSHPLDGTLLWSALGAFGAINQSGDWRAITQAQTRLANPRQPVPICSRRPSVIISNYNWQATER